MADSIAAQFQQLLATPTLPALGPESRPGVLSANALNTKLDALFATTNFPPNQQQLIRALLLLWHDHLDTSHDISQGIENADGSLVHAIMHRREPDYWNSKYWWRRVGNHPAFPEIARRVGILLDGSRRREEAEAAEPGKSRLITLAASAEQLTAKLLPGGQWDASAFVDACEVAARSARHVEFLREIQRIETEVLLETFLAR